MNSVFHFKETHHEFSISLQDYLGNVPVANRNMDPTASMAQNQWIYSNLGTACSSQHDNRYHQP
jgi:hypothetical protein